MRIPMLLLSAYGLTLAAPLDAAELTPLLGYSGGGNFTNTASAQSVSAESSIANGVLLGWYAAPDKQYELLYSEQQTTVGPANTRLRFQYLQLGGNYFYQGQRQPWSPFVAGGLGITRINPAVPDSHSTLRLSLSIAAGARWRISERLGLRLEVRGHATLMNNRSTVICDSGCTLAIDGDALYQLQGTIGLGYRF